jgi:hypothetical protein
MKQQFRFNNIWLILAIFSGAMSTFCSENGSNRNSAISKLQDDAGSSGSDAARALDSMLKNSNLDLEDSSVPEPNLPDGSMGRANVIKQTDIDGATPCDEGKQCVNFANPQEVVFKNTRKGRFDIRFNQETKKPAKSCDLQNTVIFDVKSTHDGQGPWEGLQSLCANREKDMMNAWDNIKQKACNHILELETQQLLAKGISDRDNQSHNLFKIVRTKIVPGTPKIKGSKLESTNNWRNNWYEVECGIEIIYHKGIIDKCICN